MNQQDCATENTRGLLWKRAAGPGAGGERAQRHSEDRRVVSCPARATLLARPVDAGAERQHQHRRRRACPPPRSPAPRRQPNVSIKGGMVRPASDAAERHAGLLDREHEVAARVRRVALQHVGAGEFAVPLLMPISALASSATASEGTWNRMRLAAPSTRLSCSATRCPAAESARRSRTARIARRRCWRPKIAIELSPQPTSAMNAGDAIG